MILKGNHVLVTNEQNMNLPRRLLMEMTVHPLKKVLSEAVSKEGNGDSLMEKKPSLLISLNKVQL